MFQSRSSGWEAAANGAAELGAKFFKKKKAAPFHLRGAQLASELHWLDALLRGHIACPGAAFENPGFSRSVHVPMYRYLCPNIPL